MWYPTSRALLTLCLFAAASPLCAQRGSADADDRRWLDTCHDGWGDRDRGRDCEVRPVSVRLSGHALEIDGRENGGIHVVGWAGDSVRVTARLQANARDDALARDLLKDVKIVAEGGRIHAEGPREWGRNESWSVSYIVFVPRRFNLHLDAHNGGLGVEGVAGRIDMRTTNGSVSLVDIGGDVRAHTQNGSLTVQLAGTKWEGSGLDAETRNGSVRMSIPDSYAAQIETETVNGHVSTDFPIGEPNASNGFVVTLDGPVQARCNPVAVPTTRCPSPLEP